MSDCPNCGQDFWFSHLDTDSLKENEIRCCNCKTIYNTRIVNYKSVLTLNKERTNEDRTNHQKNLEELREVLRI